MVEGGELRPCDAEQDPWPGRALAEQIEVRSLIGVGAMGRVYLGHQRGVERAVAVKVLHPELMHNAAVLARFHREARVASRLNHPNVVQVLMTGELTLDEASDPTGGEGHHAPTSAAYLVMEYLDGPSLAAVLEAQAGPLPLERALHIVLQVCDAVGEAHDQGIVHRDLKPENVMLVRRGGDPDFVKVLDFGVAKLDWLDGAQATQVGSVFGTARYISPEGAYGEEVTPRSDVYSIATMLYQCLTGRTPFDGNNTVAVLVKQRAEPPPHLRTLNADVPEPIAGVVHQNLAKSPEDRASTARELGAALLAAARAARVDSETLAHRPTLHGPKTSAPTPVPPATAATNKAPPRELTLIDPELAQIPVGGAPRTNARPWTELGPLSFAEPAKPLPAPLPRLTLETTVETVAPSPGVRRLSRSARWMVAVAAIAGAGGLFLARELRSTAAGGLQAELDRANAALAVGTWRTTDKRGFVDVTDAALVRFPDSYELTELRLRGARRLAREARRIEDLNPTRAVELAELARHLAPADPGVAALVAPLYSRPTVTVAAHAATEPAPPPPATARSLAALAERVSAPEAAQPVSTAAAAPVTSPSAENKEPLPTKPLPPARAAAPAPSSEAPVTDVPTTPPSSEETPLDEPAAPGGRWL